MYSDVQSKNEDTPVKVDNQKNRFVNVNYHIVNTDSHVTKKKYRSLYGIDGNAYYGVHPKEQQANRKRLIVSKLQNFPLHSKEYSGGVKISLSNIILKDSLGSEQSSQTDKNPMPKYLIHKPGVKTNEGDKVVNGTKNSFFKKSHSVSLNQNFLSSIYSLENNEDYNDLSDKKKGGKVELLKSPIKSPQNHPKEKWAYPESQKKIILIQSTWRRYWLRASLYQKIYIYYRMRTFIEHLKKVKAKFEKKYIQAIFKKMASINSIPVTDNTCEKAKPFCQTSSDWKRYTVTETEKAMLDKLKQLKIRSLTDIERFFNPYARKNVICKESEVCFVVDEH